MIRALRLLAIAFLPAAAVSCGVVDSAESPPASDDALPATRVFADDADAGLADQPIVPGEILIQAFPGTAEQALAEAVQAAGATIVDQVQELDLTVLTVSDGTAETVAASLAQSGWIEEIHRVYVFTAERTADDSLAANQTHLDRVNLPAAWDISVGEDSVIIGVVDSGIDRSHPDLRDKILTGWNVYDQDSAFDDDAGHGTQAAGVAAATSDNALGVVGVAWASPIVAVRAADDTGRSSSRHLAAGILRAAQEGARVINVSFAPLWSNSVVRAAAEHVAARGSLVVISAGNGGQHRDAEGFEAAIFVGALVDDTRIAPFSDRGPFVDVVAPGTAIQTTSLGGSYGPATGTSFAAPIVTGVAALMWSVNPGLRPSTIAELLRRTSVDLGNVGPDDTFGFGRVDAAAAVAAAVSAAESEDQLPPQVRLNGPRNGSRQSRPFAVRVSATDDTGVADVVLLIDGVPFATDTRTPFLFAVDPAAVGAGEHEITVVATDAAGHASVPASVQVVVAGSGSATPVGSVAFRSPRDGSVLNGDVTLSADVTAPSGLATVEWIIDEETVLTQPISGTTSLVTYRWRSSGRTEGEHVIVVRVIDNDGATFSGTLLVTTQD